MAAGMSEPPVRLRVEGRLARITLCAPGRGNPVNPDMVHALQAAGEWQGIDLQQFPNVLRWYRTVAARPGVQRGYDVPKKGHEIPSV